MENWYKFNGETNQFLKSAIIEANHRPGDLLAILNAFKSVYFEMMVTWIDFLFEDQLKKRRKR